MTTTKELIAAQINAALNRKTFGLLLQVIQTYGAEAETGTYPAGSKDNTTAIQEAIDEGGMVGVPDGKYKVSAITNLRGVPFFSTGLIYADDGTNRVVKNSYADVNQHVFGREYLSAFHKKLMVPSAAKVIYSGDSTTAGNGATAGYTITELMNYLVNKDGLGSLITTVNSGQSGKDTQQWVDSYLAADLAQNPDLYVLRWGINDPGYDQAGATAAEGVAGDATRRTVDDFKTSLRAGLATIRASKTLSQMSIVLMSPNSTYDTPNRRDTLWYEQINNVIRQAARDYQCVFFDTYALWQDSVNGGDYMDSPYTDQRHIHPADVMNEWIAGELYQVILPYAIRNHVGGGITNHNSSFLIKGATELPSLYPKGVSMHRATTGFPYNGSVTTFNQSDGILLQINNGFDTNLSEYAFRIGYRTTNAWSAWTYIGAPSASIAPTLLNSWVNYSAAHRPAGFYKDSSGLVRIEGLIKSGTATPGTTIFTLPSGYRPSKDIYFPTASNGAHGEVTITSAGSVNIVAGSNTYFSLDGISFPAR